MRVGAVDEGKDGGDGDVGIHGWWIEGGGTAGRVGRGGA